MIRDRLVVGFRDEALSQRLQLDADLTLEKTKKMIRQREAVQEQQLVLKEEPKTLDGLRANQGFPRKRMKQHPKQCFRCGNRPHPWESCPAREAWCHRCKRKGHYESQCRSRVVADLQCEENCGGGADSAIDAAFLGTMDSNRESTWRTKLLLSGLECDFKLDTGAEVTAISDQTYQSISNCPLTVPDKKLYGPAQNKLEVLGKFEGSLSHQGKTCKQTIYVVKGLKTNLLGLPAIVSLNLIARLGGMEEAKVSNSNDIPEKFSSVFQGLGNMGEPYDIKLKPDAKPYALFTPRNIPLPLRPRVEEELQRMEKLGVISKVDMPTPWCAGLVVVPKKNGKVRLCVDMQPLNKHVLREVHPLPKVDETLAQLSGAKFFSKLDANSGFWQIPLSERSKLLTTFITPQGRYCFNKLPFGICSAPEHFQKRMSHILAGLDGVVSSIDDILVYGKDREEHDTRLTAALKRILDAGITLNREKCEFAKSRILFLGHIVGQCGVQVDPERVKAINEMSPPENISKLRGFLGMVNQLGKFSYNLAELTQPLRELIKKGRVWAWDSAQQEAFTRVKEELCKSPVLSFYDPNAATKISADASSYGLGAVLLQEHNSVWKPVAYASRSMTKTETRYAQVEKEVLAITWACDKFATYIIGLKVLIETDHKPLIPLLGSKHLDDLPPRILRFRLRLARVDYSIVHVPGKLLYTADALSRAPRSTTENDVELEEDTEHMMEVVVGHLPATKQKLCEYARAQASDPVCAKVLQYCQQGWPDKHHIETHLKPYWKVRGELTVGQDLLLYGQRIVVPKSLQQETLRRIHDGHQGIQRSQLRARLSVWWPGVGSQIKSFVQNCPTCVRNHTPRHEPLMSTPLPDYPWQKVASDLFYWKGEHYLVVVDYFSRYPEVIKLKSTTSSMVIEALKAIFSRHGIPEMFVSDNGPQYASGEFARFASRYNFLHITSSPYFPQSNGCAERAVQTIKKRLKDSDDPYLTLLIYRSTPLPWCSLSPSQLLMGRRLRANLPLVAEQLKPEWSYLEDFCEQDSSFKRKQKEGYDRRHGVHPLPPIPDDSEVWITSDKNRVIPGRVTGQRETPRSYTINTPNGQVCRNRHQLNVMPSPQSSSPDPVSVQAPSTSSSSVSPAPNRIMTRSQTGTAIYPPKWPKSW